MIIISTKPTGLRPNLAKYVNIMFAVFANKVYGKPKTTKKHKKGYLKKMT